MVTCNNLVNILIPIVVVFNTVTLITTFKKLQYLLQNLRTGLNFFWKTFMTTIHTYLLNSLDYIFQGHFVNLRQKMQMKIFVTYAS